MSLRWIFGKLGKAFETFTRMGASDKGVLSGELRSVKAVGDKMAADILSGPQLAGLKMLASQLNFDLDAYIEEHGALSTLTAAQQIAGLFGVDLKSIMEKGLKGLLGEKTEGSSGLP